VVVQEPGQLSQLVSVHIVHRFHHCRPLWASVRGSGFLIVGLSAVRYRIPVLWADNRSDHFRKQYSRDDLRVRLW
jgi:hypothetical protein